jgi:arabinofuranosyltransferase
MLFFIVIFTYLFLVNSWVCDDAFVTFRVVDNLLNGHGLTWNTAERVQAYTNPLWLFVTAIFNVVISDVSLAAQLAAYLSCLLALLYYYRKTENVVTFTFFFLLVISSKAFMDYTSSGLENPLNYLLITIFYLHYFHSYKENEPPQTKDIFFLLIIASLAFVSRMDMVLLVSFPLLHLLIKSVKNYKWKLVKIISIGTLPASLWVLFALVYYGFLFPNTYYAKLSHGIPDALIVRQGLSYVLNSLVYDPVSLITIALAAALAVHKKSVGFAIAALSAVLYVLYTIKVGGDFMSGRYIAVPFLLAAIVVSRLIEKSEVTVAMIAILVAWNIINPLAPIKSGAAYESAWNWKDYNGIHDERGAYNKATNLLLYNPIKSMFERGLERWTRKGIRIRANPAGTSAIGGIGMAGYYAGPDKYIVDFFALSDTFLARLPASKTYVYNFHIGHFERAIPRGYMRSVEEGKNLLKDEKLKDYYEGLLRITRGNIFSWGRFRHIWDYNFGSKRVFKTETDTFTLTRAATNRIFKSMAGKRDKDKKVIVSDGEEGLLQYGPNVPLEKGRYRVTWIGTIESVSGDEIGYVDVVTDHGRQVIKRSSIGYREKVDYKGTLAELDFELEEFTFNVEFRFYSFSGSRLELNDIMLRKIK